MAVHACTPEAEASDETSGTYPAVSTPTKVPDAAVRSDETTSQTVGSDDWRVGQKLRFASTQPTAAERAQQRHELTHAQPAQPTPIPQRSSVEPSKSEAAPAEVKSNSAAAQPHQASESASDTEQPDPRILTFERFCRRLHMPEPAIESWRDTVSMPWAMAPFHTTLAPATMILVVATYIGGTFHMSTGRKISLYIITAVNVLAHAGSFTGVWTRGPQYIEKYPKLAGCQLLLHVITSSYLEWSLLLAPEKLLPYQNRFAFLALLTAEHWCGFASAISGGIPWDKHLRSVSLWPIFWNASLRTAKGADIHSSLMYCRLLHDKVHHLACIHAQLLQAPVLHGRFSVPVNSHWVHLACRRYCSSPHCCVQVHTGRCVSDCHVFAVYLYLVSAFTVFDALTGVVSMVLGERIKRSSNPWIRMCDHTHADLQFPVCSYSGRMHMMQNQLLSFDTCLICLR